MTQQWTTHGIELRPGSVHKRFRPGADGEAEREWRALTLLERHAPGLAPRPLARADGSVTMSRLPGTVLRGAELTEDRLDALARAVRRLHGAVPAAETARLPRRRWDVAESAAAVRSRADAVRGPAARRALAAGLRWLDGAQDGLCAGESSSAPVLGQADGNLANFLWDGADVRLVDFEDSGRSDRPYELAEMVEHVSAWAEPRPGAGLDAGAFLARCGLSPAEEVRLLECRRLFALLWLVFLAADAATAARNPPGTGERQALRLLELLG